MPLLLPATCGGAIWPSAWRSVGGETGDRRLGFVFSPIPTCEGHGKAHFGAWLELVARTLILVNIHIGDTDQTQG